MAHLTFILLFFKKSKVIVFWHVLIAVFKERTLPDLSIDNELFSRESKSLSNISLCTFNSVYKEKLVSKIWSSICACKELMIIVWDKSADFEASKRKKENAKNSKLSRFRGKTHSPFFRQRNDFRS
jgi:hypothetical protein